MNGFISKSQFNLPFSSTKIQLEITTTATQFSHKTPKSGAMATPTPLAPSKSTNSRDSLSSLQIIEPEALAEPFSSPRLARGVGRPHLVAGHLAASLGARYRVQD